MLGQIFINIIIPVFVLIGIGVLLDRIFKLDVETLSKLNFYVFVPALCFVKIIETQFTAGQVGIIAGFTVLHMVVLFLLAVGLTVLPGLSVLSSHRTVFAQSATFTNCGNFGIPFIALAVGGDAVGVMALIVVLQNFIMFTFGIWQFERGKRGSARVLLNLFKIPVVYAVLLGWLLHYLAKKSNFQTPEQVMVPLRYLSDGLIPVALLTLGVELSRSRMAKNAFPVGAASLMRLVISPLVAILMVAIFHIKEPLSTILILASGFPVAVNVFILATEYKTDREFASQSIFWTTILSAFTLSFLVYLFK